MSLEETSGDALASKRARARDEPPDVFSALSCAEGEEVEAVERIVSLKA